MRLSVFLTLVLSLVGAGTTSALTLSLTITGLISGTPSPQYAGVGSGSALALTFDLPETAGSPFATYSLSALFTGLPSTATGVGFGFGPPGAQATPVTLSGSTGDLGDPTMVQLYQIILTGAAPVDLTQYTHFVPGSGTVPLPLGSAIEAAALAGDLTQGTLTLADQVSPVASNRWTYSFAVVPEPSAATLVLAAASLYIRRRRRCAADKAAAPRA